MSTVLGTFEAHSMTNYIISRLSKFLQTKMDRKKSKVFGKWGRGFLFKPAVSFALCDVTMVGGELGGGMDWKGVSTCTHLSWGVGVGVGAE